MSEFKKELLFNGKHYGISRLGGILENKNSNANCWTVWYVKRNNKFICLNDIRNEYRKKELHFNPA